VRTLEKGRVPLGSAPSRRYGLVSHQASINGQAKTFSVVAEQQIRSMMKIKIRKKIMSKIQSKRRIIHVVFQ
jgi:hypothetical protein